VPKKLLTEAPVILMAYDLLGMERRGLARQTAAERRAQLEAITDLPADMPLRISPRVAADDWADLTTARAQSRDLGAEG
jgi:DNA ligase-1